MFKDREDRRKTQVFAALGFAFIAYRNNRGYGTIVCMYVNAGRSVRSQTWATGHQAWQYILYIVRAGKRHGQANVSLPQPQCGHRAKISNVNPHTNETHSNKTHTFTLKQKHTHRHAHTQAQTYTHTHTHSSTNIHTRTYTLNHKHAHTRSSTNIHTHTRSSTNIRRHAQIHTQAQT